MAVEIRMPALAPGMERGRLARWLVAEGEGVEPGQILAEIESDKATLEFEATGAGTIGRILVAEGAEDIPVDTVIALLHPPGVSAPADRPAPATADTPAPALSATPPETAKAPEPAPAPEPATVTTPATGPAERILASPLARRLARERGIDLATLSGSGPGGRIVEADLAPISAPPPQPRSAVPLPTPAPSTGDEVAAIAAFYADRPHRVLPLTPVRRTIAARLAEAKATIPHFYLRRDLALDPLLDLRARMNAGLARRGLRLTVTDFLVKAAALALEEVPEANVVWAGDGMLSLEAADVAVAVATDWGLYTAVLRDAATRPISALSTELRSLSERARAGRLQPRDYLGGGITISNLGMHGVESFDAIVNPPQAAILAVGAATRRPIVTEAGEIVAATRVSVTLSVDHRAIDGALGAAWLAAFADRVESPAAMLA